MGDCTVFYYRHQAGNDFWELYIDFGMVSSVYVQHKEGKLHVQLTYFSGYSCNLDGEVAHEFLHEYKNYVIRRLAKAH